MREHWFNFLTTASNVHREKRIRWKILREGLPLEDLIETKELHRSWNVVAELGTAATGAIKLLLESSDHSDRCEMVVLFPPKGQRATVCVSSQIGCGVGCAFCATGTMGFKRNLHHFEILEQVAIARRIACQNGRYLRNLVFMGMGEPLHNFDAVAETLHWLIDDLGFGMSPRSITVSTSGSPANMLQLAKRYPLVRIALSLHSANQTNRRELMPRVANDLDQLRATLRCIHAIQIDQPVWIEYVLLSGVNDTSDDARQLIQFCDGLHVEVNLIPYNRIEVDPLTTTSPPFRMTGRDEQKAFADLLREAGIITTIRHSFGQETDAACGQLVLRENALPILK